MVKQEELQRQEEERERKLQEELEARKQQSHALLAEELRKEREGGKLRNMNLLPAFAHMLA